MTSTSKDFVVNEYNFVGKFKCLANKCPDTCCQIWDMQVDQNTKALYETAYPELNQAIIAKDNNFILKKDCQSNSCINLDKGLCSIEKKHGSAILGDACFFYPRIIHKIQQHFVASASLSCPEITRLAILEEEAFKQKIKFYERLPIINKNLFTGSGDYNYFLKIHNFFLKLIAKESNNHFLLKIIHISPHLNNIHFKEWYDVILAVNQIGATTPEQYKFDKYDPIRIIQLLLILVKATQVPVSPRIIDIFVRVERNLNCKINLQEIFIDCLSDKYIKIDEKLTAKQTNFAEKILKRWLKTQLINSFFPIAGLGTNMEEKTKFLVIKYLINKISIYLILNEIEDFDQARHEIINSIYIISRYLDHLADLNLFNSIIKDYLWDNNYLVGVIKNI